MYLVLKPFNRLYRPRDFVFIRHVFRKGPNCLYIADKDIQNSSFPPFVTVVRGRYNAIWGITCLKNKVKLALNIFMDNCGYLNENQNTNLVLNYLKQFGKIPEFLLLNFNNRISRTMFDMSWDVNVSANVEIKKSPEKGEEKKNFTKPAK